jgi:hypothetical protein
MHVLVVEDSALLRSTLITALEASSLFPATSIPSS